MPSAQERESALLPVREHARQAVAALEAEIKGHEAEAHDAYVQGSTASGDAYHEKAAAAKPLLAAACERLRTLDEAVQVLAADRHQEQLEARLARARMAHAEAVAESQRRTAEIRPALAVAQRSIKLGQQSEDLARGLESQIDELEIALGLRERGKFYPATSAVRAMLEEQPFLRDLLRLDI